MIRFNQNIKLVLVVLVSCACLGCSSYKLRENAQRSALVQQRQAMSDFGNPPLSSLYRFSIDDVVEIKFFNNEEFNEVVRVRPDGRISLAMLDEVYVLGKTPMQLDSIVTAVYAKIIQQPEVTVFVREFGVQQVFLFGQVAAPGVYEMSRDMTLLHAIAAAGGLREGAETRSIMILRRKNRTSLSAYKVDVTPLLKRQPTSKPVNPTVRPMDIVYVPKTYIASANAFLKQVYDLLLPPTDIYMRALWYNQLAR